MIRTCLLFALMIQPVLPQSIRVELEKSGGTIAVGPNVRVSDSRSDQTHVEVLVAADPEDPKRLLACSMVKTSLDQEHGYGTVVYVSINGGKSWEKSLHIPDSFDPACAYGPAGVAYMTALRSYTSKSGGMTVIFKSVDGGKTFALSAELAKLDREYITVDNTSGKYRSRVYVGGSGYTGSLDEPGKLGTQGYHLLHSSPMEGVFLGPAVVSPTEPNHSIAPPSNGVVLSDGIYVAIVGEVTDASNYGMVYDSSDGAPFRANRRIVAVSSRDGGRTVSAVGIVNHQWHVDAERKATSGTNLALAADGSSGPFKDRLYAAWSDRRSGRVRVLVAHSIDKGKTWSEPTQAADDSQTMDVPSSHDDAIPAIAVNSLGVVGVSWYDRRDSRGEVSYWPRFSASMDGGETFLPSVKLSEAPFTLKKHEVILSSATTWHPPGDNFVFRSGVDRMEFSGGDTSGLAATSDGVFHALWVDNRTGVNQPWTAAIRVNGATRHPDEAFPTLTDTTSKAELHFGRVTYDRIRHVLTVDVSIENISKSLLEGPIKLRLLSLNSTLGQISVLNADNRLSGVAAVWDFTEQLDQGVLNAGAKSRPKRLQFRIRERPDVDRSYRAWLDVIKIDAKLLATTKSTIKDSK